MGCGGGLSKGSTTSLMCTTARGLWSSTVGIPEWSAIARGVRCCSPNQTMSGTALCPTSSSPQGSIRAATAASMSTTAWPTSPSASPRWLYLSSSPASEPAPPGGPNSTGSPSRSDRRVGSDLAGQPRLRAEEADAESWQLANHVEEEGTSPLLKNKSGLD